MLISSDQKIIDKVDQVISENELGYLLMDKSNNELLAEKIKINKPNIIILDLEFSNQSDLRTLETLYKFNFPLEIITLISPEDSKHINDMYRDGVHFVLRKPIYYYELFSILDNIYTNKQLQESIDKIHNTIINLDYFQTKVLPYKSTSFKEEIYNIFNHLGIIGENGCENLISLIELILKYKDNYNNNQYLLKDFYQDIAILEGEKQAKEINPSSIEQRIRRLLQKALTNISELGLNDFANPIFDRYATYLFDFQQVRQEMNFLKGDSNTRGQVNIRKFVEALIFIIEN